MRVWNFIGAGVFGFLINLPIVSYFEVGTMLTPNHGHAAFMGVFGMLAIALIRLYNRPWPGDLRGPARMLGVGPEAVDPFGEDLQSRRWAIILRGV